MAQPPKADRVIPVDQVPEPPVDAKREKQPNGGEIIQVSNKRWRYRADGVLRYFIQYRTSADGMPLITKTFEQMYDGPK